MIDRDIEILTKLIIVERMNIYLATQGALAIYKKIQNWNILIYRYSY